MLNGVFLQVIIKINKLLQRVMNVDPAFHNVAIKKTTLTQVIKWGINIMCSLQVRDHPFKTSALFRGGEVSPLPMFADSRGVGVKGIWTSAI